MNWFRTWRADPVGRVLADRHYSRKTVGAAPFAPPGRNLTLRTLAGDALWVTCWPLPEFVDHEWGDCWTCTLFRNEGDVLSSELVNDAVAATRWRFGDPPPGGFLTFVDVGKVRRKRDPGRCFRKAGFRPAGYTKDRGLLALQLEAHMIGPAVAPFEFQLSL